MVAGAGKVCIWKPNDQKRKLSSEVIVAWIQQKREFTRGLMEKSLGLTLGQAEWWIKELRKKGLIKRTRKIEYKFGKGQRQVIYRYSNK